MREIRVRWLRNHGARVIYTSNLGTMERFVRPGEAMTILEAAVALKVHKTKVRRLIERGVLTGRRAKGKPLGVLIGDVRSCLDNPAALADGRTTRHQPQE